MFDFLDMIDNYDDRKVARFENEDLIVSTCEVTDSSSPYETAVSHPRYNDGSFVVVEMYESREDAQLGHTRWVETMTTEPLPESLEDRGTSSIGKMAKSFDPANYVFPKTEKSKEGVTK